MFGSYLRPLHLSWLTQRIRFGKMSTNRYDMSNEKCSSEAATVLFHRENVSTFRAPGLTFFKTVGKMEKEMFSRAGNKRGNAKQGGKDEKNPSKEVNTLPPFP